MERSNQAGPHLGEWRRFRANLWCCHRLVKHMVEGSAPLARFLVLGVNHEARKFYSYYRESHRPQILEFIGVGAKERASA